MPPSSKLENIKRLRQTVACMQDDLRAMQTRNQPPSQMPAFLKPVLKMASIKKKRMFKHTQRELSFDSKQNQGYFRKEESLGQKERQGLRINTEKSLSAALKQITGRVQNNYYRRTEQERGERPSKQGRRLSRESVAGRRVSPGMVFTSSSPKIDTKKVFQVKRTSTVLCPESNKQKGLKIVHKIERSPNGLLFSHPKSNSNAFVVSEKEVIIQPRRPIYDRNQSSLNASLSRERLNRSKEGSLEKTAPCQRKHFERYTTQFYSCPFQSNAERALR